MPSTLLNMQARYAVLADYVVEAIDGKLTVSGIFDRIVASKVPVHHGPFCLVARLEGSVVEGSVREIRIRCVDVDHQDVLEVLGPVSVRFALNGPGRPLAANVILRVDIAVFPGFGDYELKIIDEDGRTVATIPLTVDEQKSE